MNTRDKGNLAEEQIANIFLAKGYRILCRNYTIHNVGELDIVFIKNDTVYVTEVRARKHIPGFPTPAESVTRSKRQKILKTTRYLINEFNLYDKNVYFLIGQVTLDEAGLVQNVEFTPFE